MSNHPVHLLSMNKKLMPSALIPYCSFSNDLLSLGQKLNNFSFPVCTAFKPTLLDGQLCYQLDTNRIKNQTKPTQDGGLVLLLDVSKERSFDIRLKTNDYDIPSNTELYFTKGNHEEQQLLPNIYISTIHPSRIYLGEDTRIVLTSIKEMTGTANFLALPTDKKHCSVDDLTQCELEEFLLNNAKYCNCIPYGHEYVMTTKSTTLMVS